MHIRPTLVLLAFTHLASVALARQEHLARDMPTESALTALVEAARGSWDSSLHPLRGVSLGDGEWGLVPLEGCAPDPSGLRYRLSAGATETYAICRLHRAKDPTPEVQAQMSTDFLQLSYWLLEAKGEWVVSSDFVESAGVTASSLLTRLRPPGASGLPFEISLWLRKGTSRRTGWYSWDLELLLRAPGSKERNQEPGAEPDPGMPTEAAFVEVVELMKQGAYAGLETIKALESPEDLWKRNGNSTRWGLWPLEGLAPDPRGERHYMARFAASTDARYELASVVEPSAKERARLEADFERMRGWLAAHSDGWAVNEAFDPWSYVDERSRLFSLVPLAGSKVERVDGLPVPRIELWLAKGEDRAGDPWRLTLECVALGQPKRGNGTAPWVAALTTGGAPARELPPIPADLGAVLLALAADAPNSFAGSLLTGEALQPDENRSAVPGDWPFVPRYSPRWAVTNPLRSDQDPVAHRDYLAHSKSRWESWSSLRLAHLVVSEPNRSTQVAVDARFEELRRRMEVALVGWRGEVVDVPGGKEDFKVRLATFQGLREDGHPVLINLERLTWISNVRGYPNQEHTSLALYVSTDHEAFVGYDVQAAWDQEAALHQEPLATAIEVFGRPLGGLVQEGDRVVAPNGLPLPAIELYGVPGESEVRLPLVRDGGYSELVLPRATLSLAQYRELQQQAARGAIGPAGLSFLATCLDGVELSTLVRDLVAAAEEDFTALPVDHAEWLEPSADEVLLTVTVPLYRARQAPSGTVIEGLRIALQNTFDGTWILDETSRVTGPYWDPYSELTHWTARRSGPEGVAPWAELVEVPLGEQVSLELRVHGFTKAHRSANADTPERLWFHPVGGDCVDGRGMAFCYRTGLVFDGPFRGGVPHGTGEHVFRDGTALVDTVYENGKLVLMGHDKPVPVVSSWDSEAYWADFDAAVETARIDWSDRSASGPKLSDWQSYYEANGIDIDAVFLTEPPAFVPFGGGGRTCQNCYGSGSVWASVDVEVYQDTMLLSGSRLYSQGYTHVRDTSKTRTYSVDQSVACYSCNGTGYN